METEQSPFFSKHIAIWLGMLHVSWSAYEGVLDCLATELLGLSDADGHYVTSGMDHQRKIKTVKALLKRSARSEASAIRQKIGEIAKQHKWNVLVHSYVMVNPDARSITFVSRRMNEDYDSKEHVFALEEFMQHVSAFAEGIAELQRLCGYSNERIDAFCKAALVAASA